MKHIKEMFDFFKKNKGKLELNKGDILIINNYDILFATLVLKDIYGDEKYIVYALGIFKNIPNPIIKKSIKFEFSDINKMEKLSFNKNRFSCYLASDEMILMICEDLQHKPELVEVLMKETNIDIRKSINYDDFLMKKNSK